LGGERNTRVLANYVTNMDAIKDTFIREKKYESGNRNLYEFFLTHNTNKKKTRLANSHIGRLLMQICLFICVG
jgi:hypothetical protein